MGPRLIRIVLKRKNKRGGTTPLDIKTYYMPTITKTVWFWWKDRHTNQQDRETRNRPK
jgi:hypothetical protein